MATDALHTNSSAWPQVGNPPPNAISPTDPNPEWEMVADNDINNNANTANNNNSSDTTAKEDDNDHVLILPANIHSSMQSNTKVKGRPRSATIGGERLSSSPNKSSSLFHRANTTTAADFTTDSNSDMSSRTKRRTLRRCASTPDLFVSDNAHEVIVEDESDEESGSSCCDEELSEELGDSFEVVSTHEEEEEVDQVEQSGDADPDADNSGADNNNDEPLFNLIEGEEEECDFQRSDEESATLVSTPSMDTSTAWTMASAIPSTTATTGGSMWGMKKSPSFAEMLAKNINSDNNTNFNGTGWGSDKTKTEAMLRDSHRKHHLRVKTKPKFIVTEDTGGKTMKHAHSTGDLSQMLVGAERERARMFGQAGRKRMSKKQFSDIMEEDDDDASDFVIGRGSGGGSGGGGGYDGDVLGETDAMDFYHRKDKGSKGTSNKKKLRPDEAKRRDIIMHKKEMQRKKQAESQKAAGSGASDKSNKSGKKKKNEKGMGGKKERRRL